MALEGDACGSAMRPSRQQYTAADVELADADAYFALARKQRFSVEQDAHAGPVGDRHQRGHGRLNVGHIKEAGDVAARPGCPSAISQPATQVGPRLIERAARMPRNPLPNAKRASTALSVSTL